MVDFPQHAFTDVPVAQVFISALDVNPALYFRMRVEATDGGWWGWRGMQICGMILWQSL